MTVKEPIDDVDEFMEELTKEPHYVTLGKMIGLEQKHSETTHDFKKRIVQKRLAYKKKMISPY